MKFSNSNFSLGALAKNLQKLRPLWDALDVQRQHQLIRLQLFSIAAAAAEVANLGTLLPFLRILANPSKGVDALGALSKPLRLIPEDYLLFVLGLCFIFVVMLSTWLRASTIRMQLRLVAQISSDLGYKIFSEILKRPYHWHLENNSSEVIGYLTKDVDQVNASIQAISVIVVNFAIVALLGGSLILISPYVMLLVGALLIAFYLLVFHFTRGSLRSDGDSLTRYYQSSLQVAQESLGGIRDVLIDSNQSFFSREYGSRNLKYRLAIASININAQVPRYLIEGFTVVLIVGLSLALYLRGQGIQQILPLLGTLALGSYRLLQPMQQCFSSISIVQANHASFKRIEPFLNVSAERYLSKNSKHVNPTRDSFIAPFIQIKDVSFRYSKQSNWVIRDLSLSINRGDCIAFVGSTGSGKSTCMDLILGLLKPTNGNLCVDGNVLHDQNFILNDWQSRIAHVPQSIYLSDASFASNIAFGLPICEINLNRVRAAAKLALIEDTIDDTDHGFNTLVGERGVRLSGGQRQRIGLARAFYKQAELLILDEATSALDNRTEAEVMAAIGSLAGKITLLMVAHRLSTVKCCDRIIVLEKGKIVGNDTFENLSRDNIFFQRLANQLASVSS